MFRMASGAIPFLLPLLLQIGFGLTPFASGSLTLAVAMGAMGMKFTAPRILRAYGFRKVLTLNTAIAMAFMAAILAFTPTTPHVVIFAVLLIGGFFRSLQFTALNALGYSDLEGPAMSQATSLSSVIQQISTALGVAVAARTLVTIGTLSILVFVRLKPDAGQSVSGHSQVVSVTTESEVKPI